MSEGRTLKLGIPKGSLQDTTVSLFAKAGFRIDISGHSYYPAIDDPEVECILIRAQEMARYVEQGVMDAGITGIDWVLETGAQVEELADLRAPWPNYRPVRWVLAVKAGGPLSKVEDLAGKRIATEAVGLTRQYLERNGVDAIVEFSWGATEVKAPELVDAIVEITETGSSLRANNLRIVDTVLESTTRFIVNQQAWEDPGKRKKIEQVVLLLQGALAAESKVLLKMNVNQSALDAVLGQLPSLHAPTVNQLSEKGWLSIETVLEEHNVREIIPRLKEAGAEGIIELALNKVVP